MNTSVIYQIPDDEFKKMIQESRNYTELIAKCGMKSRGANRKTIIRRMKLLGVDYTHLKSNRGKTFEYRRYTLDDVKEKMFVCPSGVKTGTLKKLILRHKLIPYKCECGIESLWRDNPISLQLEHINGNHEDNRLNNLKFLCPNCHSQTTTFAGKSSYKQKNAEDYEKYNTREFKSDCALLSAQEVKAKYKISQWLLRRICNLVGTTPPKQKQAAQKVKWTESILLELAEDVKHSPLRRLQEKYGVSANRLKEVCQSHNIVVLKRKV
jgi:predicted RNA-binding Zn-ribbon protein involved in translation (DUF1610 family)